jgi:hypothetical protein
MTEIVFDVRQEDLTAYHYTVRDRLLKFTPKAWWETDAVRASALFGVAALTFAGLDAAAPSILGRSLEVVELLAGFVLGLLMAVALMWLSYWDQIRRAVRKDGPTLGEHTVRLNGEGLAVSIRDGEARYAWRAFQGVTRQRGLLTVWLEPGVGIMIPERAFAGEAERVQFTAEIEARLADAKLPRAGSFG